MAQILVVDDTRDVCTAMARLLRSLGHTAYTAFSGEEALDVLGTRATLPDLVILDQMMPGMDGMEVLRALRQQERTAALRVVIFSAIAEPVFQSHALTKGADAYWAKGGFDYGTLGDRIQTVIAAHNEHPLPNAERHIEAAAANTPSNHAI